MTPQEQARDEILRLTKRAIINGWSAVMDVGPEDISVRVRSPHTTDHEHQRFGGDSP